jgi:hypothetical protein
LGYGGVRRNLAEERSLLPGSGGTADYPSVSSPIAADLALARVVELRLGPRRGPRRMGLSIGAERAAPP